MYFNRGRNICLPPLEKNSGPWRDFYKRFLSEVDYGHRLASPQSQNSHFSELLSWIPDPRNLMAAFQHLRSQGGQSPGPSGITYQDFARREVWPFLKKLSRSMSDGTYRAGEVRQIEIPKVGKPGTRPLALANIEDRIVQRVIQQALGPILIPSFSQNAFGLHVRGYFDALATVRAQILAGRDILVTDDIRDAFENVPIGRLIQVLQKRVPSPETVDLIRRAIHRDDKGGLRQGSPLSPLLLYLHLDHFLDSPWHKAADSPPLLRYMDDLLIPCATEAEAIGSHQNAVRLLRSAGLSLKGEKNPTIRNVGSGEPVKWLGVQITKSGDEVQMSVDLSDQPGGWFSNLRDALAQCHELPDSARRACNVVIARISQLGPVYAGTSAARKFYSRVVAVGQEVYFEELPDFADIDSSWQRSHENWQKRCRLAKKDVANHADEPPRRLNPKKVSVRVEPDWDDAPF